MLSLVLPSLCTAYSIRCFKGVFNEVYTRGYGEKLRNGD